MASSAATASGGGVWPTGVSAWTVVIATLAKHGHPRAAAERIASSVQAPGLVAHVLDSSLHPRLRPDLWIVFAGRYSSRALALRAARQLHASGTPRAVVERLTGEVTGNVRRFAGVRRHLAVSSVRARLIIRIALPCVLARYP